MTELSIGQHYGEACGHRKTEVSLDEVNLEFTENLWTETDRFENAPDVWSITAHLRITESCGSKEEVLKNSQHLQRVIEALGALDYDLYLVKEPGVTFWHKPAWVSENA